MPLTLKANLNLGISADSGLLLGSRGKVGEDGGWDDEEVLVWACALDRPLEGRGKVAKE